MQFELETVYTVSNYWDGPRGGIADFHGKPHVYQSLFDESNDDWSDACLLQSIDDETFRLAMEAWGIWCRWEHAFHCGQTTQATHPALPEDRNRHDELEAILKPRLSIDEKLAFQRRGIFSVRESTDSWVGPLGVWNVKWVDDI